MPKSILSIFFGEKNSEQTNLMEEEKRIQKQMKKEVQDYFSKKLKTDKQKPKLNRIYFKEKEGKIFGKITSTYFLIDPNIPELQDKIITYFPGLDRELLVPPPSLGKDKVATMDDAYDVVVIFSVPLSALHSALPKEDLTNTNSINPPRQEL